MVTSYVLMKKLIQWVERRGDLMSRSCFQDTHLLCYSEQSLSFTRMNNFLLSLSFEASEHLGLLLLLDPFFLTIEVIVHLLQAQVPVTLPRKGRDQHIYVRSLIFPFVGKAAKRHAAEPHLLRVDPLALHFLQSFSHTQAT